MSAALDKAGIVVNVIAHGKRKADKRQAEKERDWQRDRARLMRDKG